VSAPLRETVKDGVGADVKLGGRRNRLRFDMRFDRTYRNEDEQEDDVRREIPWLAAVAILAVAPIALAEGCFA